MLTKPLIELIPEEPDITDGYGPALVTKGKPAESTNGPMYAELVDGSINNKVRVYFLVLSTETVEKYYYQVESSNETIIVTKVCLVIIETTKCINRLSFALCRILKRQLFFKCYPQLHVVERIVKDSST